MTDSGRLTHLISTDIGWNILGAQQEAERIPDLIAEVRGRMAPLRAEMRMLQERYQSRGRSPSHHDELRATLLAKLKEEERRKYNEDPEQRVDSRRGTLVKIELTDGRAEDLARARPEYQDFMRRAARDHKRIAQIGRELGPMYDRVEHLKGRAAFLKMKHEDAVALTNAWGRERANT